ncbi:50S ribosomal protein L5 [Chondromyces crocatus]|uniref:Large ribosomal subunit protein uL5 n=1 Tax=Chondromyces crocatus TaxID=52 RepID=A0A0K1E6Z2_CHOCO|nr:50S ribosomal protein L5 [Chondromyces crocatus]
MADKKDKTSKDAKAKEKARAQTQSSKGAQAKSQATGKSRERSAGSANVDVAGATGGRELPEGYVPRLRQHYRQSVVPALSKRFGYANPMMVPRLEKVVLNMGLGSAVQNPKVIDSAVEDLRAVSGQKPVVTRARKSIATFKLRENLPIGVMVTLRAERMWEFIDRLIAFSLPRVRDFKGVSPKGFDGKGNFTMGLREQIIFPEIDYDKIDVVKGMNISFVTTARTDEEGRALLTELGIPFRH